MARPGATEKATPKRQNEARKRGQVARSPDLGGAAVFLTLVIVLHVGFMATMNAASQAFSVSLIHAGSREDLNLHSVWGLFLRAGTPYATIVLTAFAAAVAVGVAANLWQFGFLFTPGLLAPKLAKLNPIAGLQRIFLSQQTLINLGKQFLKLMIVVLIGWMGVKDHFTMAYALAHAAPHDIVVQVEGLVYGIAVRIAIVLLVLGVADYYWEKHRLAESLKMTKTEVKDEARQAEGNPEVKGQVRQRQRTAARRRMMAAVPKATVVVTNPTHFAVALEWDELRMEAPILTAKGADLIARRIREIAAEHNVPIMENPTLARTLYAKVELDGPVPPDLYAAVAQVIAFVFKLKNRTIA